VPRVVYSVDGDESRVVAVAKSSVHDTRATMGRVSGTIEADLDALGEAGGVSLEVAVDLTGSDAGDFLRTRKLRGDIDVKRYPEARFSLARVVEISREPDGRFEATGEGVIAWRDREVTIQPSGSGTLGEDEIRAQARFALDIRDFGVQPPKFLMLKVEPVVEVEVTLVARSS
jgi:polyisoprenoid-binding protein YceI